MTHRKTADTKADRAQAAFADNHEAPASAVLLTPMMPWLHLGLGVKFEYQGFEIRLEGSMPQTLDCRKSFRNGIITDNTADALAPVASCFAVVDQMQQQTQRMMQAMFMPWSALIQPFTPKDEGR